MTDEHYHGTLNGYTNYGCRCRSCRRANAEYRKEWREQNKRVAPKEIKEEPAPYTPQRTRRLPE